MTWFITADKRVDSCCHEFLRGRWDGATFWRPDSLLLHDDRLAACPGFEQALRAVCPDWSPFSKSLFKISVAE